MKDRRAVHDFLEAFPYEQRRDEGYQLLELFEKKYLKIPLGFILMGLSDLHRTDAPAKTLNPLLFWLCPKNR